MPKYIYTAKTRDSKTVREVTSAISREDLIARLRSHGLYIVSIQEASEKTQRAPTAPLFFSMRGKRTSIKLHDLTFFARNLATTLSSGVTLLRSLEIIAYQAESLRLEKILKNCCDNIKSGLSLGEAISKYPSVFSALWRGIVHVGETSGNLPFVLDKLADYLEMRMEFERKIKSALIYPAILLTAAAMAVFVFLYFILPKFVVIFEQFDVEMPLPTQVLFNISRFCSAHAFLILGGVGALVFGFLTLYKNQAVRQYWDVHCFRIPIVGQVIFSYFLERLTSTVYILLDSGLPVVYALEVTAESVGNSLFKKNLVFVKDRVKEGASLSEELGKINIFPLLVSEMAKIGEETGTIANVFQRISFHYRKDLTTRIERVIAAFEPIMILMMGVVIGGIVVSLFLPLFRVSTLGG
jgi:type II secretory pathway component PulF